MKIKVLEWDSHFFNKKIGIIEEGEDNLILSDLDKFDLLYVKQIEDTLLEIDNFKQTNVETKVIFSKSISKYNNSSNSFIFSAFNTNINKEQIYKLAYESGKFSRFKLDDSFTKHEFEALYKRWVDNSFSKEFADEILVYKEKNTILGFITYKIFNDSATVGLIAVFEERQGEGIGRALLVSIENQLINERINELRIPTQLQNEHACEFYTKLGYKIMQKTIIKHYWKQ